MRTDRSFAAEHANGSGGLLRTDRWPNPVTPALLETVEEGIGRAIRRRRKILDLTLKQVGDRCGASFQQVQKYETGVITISAAQLWALAWALEVPVGYFFEAVATARTLQDQPAGCP